MQTQTSAVRTQTQALPTNPVTISVDASDWPTLDELRLRYIRQAINHMGNNKTRAAALLGIDRRTLNRILARERARKAALARLANPAH